VLDADALNLLSRNPSLKKYARGAVITPHAKEMERLSGISVADILSSPEKVAFEYSREHSLICVLKDHRTVVTDGEKLYKNTTGNSGMATGGSGDVLAGVIGGLLAQKHNGRASLFQLAALGVYLHGLAGDLGAKELGEYSIMASDIIDALPKILKY
jgi:NAD(P)H-hydrate epimerase